MTNLQKGFSILEVIIAAAIFVTFAAGAVVAIISGLNANRLGAEVTIANQYAAEGLEALRSIRNQNFSNISGLASTYCTNGAGVVLSGGVWTLKAASTSDSLSSDSRFTRTVKICDVQRDGSGNIVVSGTLDPNTKKITVTTSWNFSSGRPESVSFTEYLTNWKAAVALPKGGVLVYGDGGTTLDTIHYQVYNPTTDSWSAAASTADVDSGSTNKSLRAVRLFASSTRNEKVMISRHYNGSNQFIYAQVFNGTSWGNVVQLSSFAASTFLDVRNFDGTYLANGDFMVVYSDNTSIPKFRVWNGIVWSAQQSLVDLANNGSTIPLYIVLRARPGTNEAMVAFFGQEKDTNTEYFSNASGYTTASWTLHSRHAANAPVNTKELVGFSWFANNPLKGALIFASTTNDKSLTLKVFTANGSGSGSWSAAVNSANQASLGAMSLDTRKGADELVGCDKDSSNSIFCFRGNSTPAWTSPANNPLTSTTDTGIERSFDIGYEGISGTIGIGVYSDNTSSPKLKKYTASTNTFDSATSLGALSATVTGVKLVPQTTGDDIMAIMFDSNRRVYTQGWDGTNNILYTTGGRGSTLHGSNGSSVNEIFASFAWDKF